MVQIGAILLAAILLAVPQVGFAQSDLEKYLEKIRTSGMTERAAGTLEAAAKILAGETIYEVTRDPDGGLRYSYSNAMCFRPDADGEGLRKLREEIEAKRERWVLFLKQQADADGSGFVSTEEAAATMRRVELGVLFERVPDIKSIDDLLKAIQRDRAGVLIDLKEYAKLQAASVELGLKGLSVLPTYILDAI